MSPEKSEELPKRVHLAHWPQRSIVDCRSPVHDRIPLGELHHTCRVFLELRWDQAAPVHFLIHHTRDERHGVSVHQRRPRIRSEQPQGIAAVSLVNGKQLGEIIPSLPLSQLYLVRLQGIFFGPDLAEVLMSVIYAHHRIKFGARHTIPSSSRVPVDTLERLPSLVWRVGCRQPSEGLRLFAILVARTQVAQRDCRSRYRAIWQTSP